MFFIFSDLDLSIVKTVIQIKQTFIMNLFFVSGEVFILAWNFVALSKMEHSLVGLFLGLTSFFFHLFFFFLFYFLFFFFLFHFSFSFFFLSFFIFGPF